MACSCDDETEERFLIESKYVLSLASLHEVINILSNVCSMNSVMITVMNVIKSLKSTSKVRHFRFLNTKFWLPAKVFVKEFEYEEQRIVI